MLAICAQLTTLGSPPDDCCNDSVNSSRSGMVCGSFDTFMVVGLGSSNLLMVVSSVICLSEIVLRICSVFANWAWFQIDVNAV